MSQSNSIELGFPNIYVTPFLDSQLTKNLARQYVITPDRMDSGDEVTATKGKDTTTLVTGGGSKFIYTNPNEESGVMSITVLNPLADLLEELIFPDAIVTVDGTKRKVEFFDRPGLILSEFGLMVHVQIRPLNPDGTEVPANDWLTMPMAVIVPNQTNSFSAEPGKTELQIISVGGKVSGCAGSLTGTVDLSAPIDLSTGSDDKLVDLTIDGQLYANINIGQSATATASEIVDAINQAVGFIVATTDENDFLTINGIQSGGVVTLEDPTAGTTAFALIFGGVSPATNTGIDDRIEAVFVKGDETAT